MNKDDIFHDEDIDQDDFVDDFYNEIVMHRAIARRNKLEILLYFIKPTRSGFSDKY
jgi:hypothetical protein